MKNKGFVLMETIIVIVVISVALLTIFSSYNKILTKVKAENKYDTSEYIYMTEYIKGYLKDCSSSLTVYGMGTNETITKNKTLNNYYTDTSCKVNSVKGSSHLNIKKIYLLQYINDVNNDDLKKFDAYMIDYIRKLDVGNNDKLIVVEYDRPSLKTDGTQKTDSKGNALYETYIASLEW